MPSTDSPRVLVVEDFDLLAEEICRMVDEVGATAVGPALSLSAGLLLAQTEAFDAAVLDVNLGMELVFPLAGALRERKVPCVLVTGYTHAELPAEFLDWPMLLKPFTADALRDALTEMGFRLPPAAPISPRQS